MEQVKGSIHLGLRAWKWSAFLAVGLLLFGWLLNTPPGFLGKADAIGYAVCHRIEARSLQLGDRPTPLCARCSGMYLGALLGLGFQGVRSGRRWGGMPARPTWPLLALFFLAFAVDGVNSYLHLFPNAPHVYEPQNWLRTLTGSGMGLVISAALFPAFNQSVWADWQDRPALDGLRSLGILALLILGLNLVLATNTPWILYPLALASAAGVLVLLAMIYAITWLVVLRMENRFTHLAQLGWPLLGGFGVGLLQVTLLDLARYWLTGTWDGFHLG